LDVRSVAGALMNTGGGVPSSITIEIEMVGCAFTESPTPT